MLFLFNNYSFILFDYPNLTCACPGYCHSFIWLPSTRYDVYADMTSINGLTHKAKFHVYALLTTVLKQRSAVNDSENNKILLLEFVPDNKPKMPAE